MTENLYTPDCIRTFTGKYVNVFDPKPEMFCIEDIAHALSKIPRFGGHLPIDYSVAHHCVYGVIGMEGTREEKFAFLMHDATEAYLMDFPSPIKNAFPEYKAIEDNLNQVMSKVFGYQYPFPEIVHKVDKIMLEIEWNKLMINVNDTESIVFQNIAIYDTDIKDRFLRKYQQLRPKSEFEKILYEGERRYKWFTEGIGLHGIDAKTFANMPTDYICASYNVPLSNFILE